MKTQSFTEAFVLAGGKSSRMGKDKGRIFFQSRPMISYILETLENTNLSIKIIANAEAYEKFGYPVIPDVVLEKGPMGGLLTAFQNTKADQILLVSCDMPFVQKELILQLLQLAGKENIVVPEADGQVFPMPGVYPVSLIEEVNKRIDSHQLKMKDFISENRFTLLPSDVGKDAPLFQNINTPQDLKKAKERWDKLR